MRFGKIVAAAAVGTVLLASGGLHAQTPTILHYQGVLTGDEGLPVTDTLSMTFSIYDDTTGAPLWSVTEPQVVVRNGFYEVYLDPESLPFDAPYFLGIDVGGEAMRPFKPFAAVPYAMRSGRTRVLPGDGLEGGGDTMTVSLGLRDSGVTTEKIADGAVTAEKIADGQVVRSIGGAAGHVALRAGGDVTISVANDTITISAEEPDGSGGGFWEGDEEYIWTYTSDGVGIGTDNPKGRLDVAGTILAADDIYVGYGDTLADTRIRFDGWYNEQWIQWSESEQRFEISNGLAVDGAIGVGEGALFVGGETPFNYFLGGGFVVPQSGQMENSGDLYLQDDLEVADDLYVYGSEILEGNLVGQGTIYGETVRSDQASYVGYVSFNDDDTLYFDGLGDYDWLAWMDGPDRFELSNDLTVNGVLAVGPGSEGNDPAEYSYFAVDPPDPDEGLMDGAGDLYVQHDLQVGDDVQVGRNLFVEGSVVSSSSINTSSVEARNAIYCGYLGIDDDDYIYFDNADDVKWLRWREVSDRFELSRALSVGGVLAAGNDGLPGGAIYPYNYFSGNPNPLPFSGDMNTAGDLYVDWDLEAGDDLYYSGELVDLSGALLLGSKKAAEIAVNEAWSILEQLRPKVIPLAERERGKEGGGGSKFGFLPEDLPDAVKTSGGNGYRPVDLIAVLTKVVQEQQKTIEALEARVRALEAGR